MVEELFGEVLKDLRTSKGYSQEHLAELAGLDRTYVSLLERGHRQPTISTVFSLAKALNIAPSKIISQVEKLHGGK